MNILVFLLANIFTGLTNVIIGDTHGQPAAIAHIIMNIYMASMVWIGYGIAGNETVRRGLTGHAFKKDLKSKQS